VMGLLSEVRSLDGEVGWSVCWVFDGNSRVDVRGAEIACHRIVVDCRVVYDITHIVAGC
jgi:hypothetical protein